LKALIRPVETSDDLKAVRELFAEYAAGLDVNLEFQDFAAELSTLPGAYAPPTGRLLLALADGQPAGCVGLRPLTPDICEMKRLYVRSTCRGLGVGQALAEAIIAAARQLGYRSMRLDTLPAMQGAQQLYRRLGFLEIPPYRHNPVPGTVYLELTLAPGAGAETARGLT
jgi:ribosomal protein S18 acetylase RimI-like enzyme